MRHKAREAASLSFSQVYKGAMATVDRDEFREHAEFHMIGIEARTSFRKEQDGGKTFAGQWEKIRGGALSAVTNRTDGELLTLYTDYESDLFGEYTFIIGCRVVAGTPVPEGMVTRHVPAARYKVFTSAPGDINHVAIDTWKRIWADACQRTYKYDFEVYGANASDPRNSTVDIYVGCG